MFELRASKQFKRKLKKLVKRDKTLAIRIAKTMKLLELNPISQSLSTHKVIDAQSNTSFSSKVSNDLRIIWDYTYGEIQIIDLIDIGGHSGSNKVYK